VSRTKNADSVSPRAAKAMPRYEFAGYLAVALSPYATGEIASH
jgi:hypothetical protein